MVAAGGKGVAAATLNWMSAKPKGILIVLKDGKVLQEIGLPGAPALNGVAIGRGAVYLATAKGELLCFCE